jgi:hypothetical protein
LTDLDFVGRQHHRFRFDLRYRAITRSTRREIKEQVEAGFPFLPAECTIDLDRDVQRLVLDNIRQSLPTRHQRVAELQALRDVDLATYLREAGLELEDVSGDERRPVGAAGRGRLRPRYHRQPRGDRAAAGHRAPAAHR